MKEEKVDLDDEDLTLFEREDDNGGACPFLDFQK